MDLKHQKLRRQAQDPLIDKQLARYNKVAHLTTCCLGSDNLSTELKINSSLSQMVMIVRSDKFQARNNKVLAYLKQNNVNPSQTKFGFEGEVRAMLIATSRYCHTIRDGPTEYKIVENMVVCLH